MLFNSYEFIFLFLPVCLIGYVLMGKAGNRSAVSWLVTCSLFYYGWWNPKLISLIIGSILVNYTVGRQLEQSGYNAIARKFLLATGIIANLAALFYYKYVNFFLDSLNDLGLHVADLGKIALPIGISFFTFQQITYLVDLHRERGKNYSLLNYSLFVTFFPQLIAGPIVHHGEMLPQFSRKKVGNISYRNLSVGITIFVIGLAKKVLIADPMASIASPVYNLAAQNIEPTLIESWTAMIAYSFQLYFDFSGYSDMAIGLARMFGIKLPLNFNSPYKAVNVINFWRRWHITLSRFLKDYLYIPLGGNRKGKTRRYVNLMTVMIIGGIWHGAGYTFILWGFLHGLYLCVNHVTQFLRKRYCPQGLPLEKYWGKSMAILITYFFVCIAWVFFRAESFSAASLIINGLTQIQDFSVSSLLNERFTYYFYLSYPSLFGVFRTLRKSCAEPKITVL